MKITDLITPKIVATIWNEDAENRVPFLGEMLFPYTTQLSTDLAYIKGSKGAVKPLMLSAYDAKAIPVERETFGKLEKEMPFFKNSLILDEKTKRELQNVVASGNQQLIDIVTNRIYNDQKNLVERARVAREVMRMQALTSGVISFSNNGQTLSMDYEMSNDNKVTPTNKWTDTENSTPIQDITNWKKQVLSKTGVTPTNIIMNSTTFSLLVANKSVRSAFLVSSDITFIGDSRVKNYIKSETGSDIIIYDKVYQSHENKNVQYIPDNIVILAPDVVGQTVMSPSPEEYDLMTGLTSAKVEIVDNNIAITTEHQTDPVVLVTKVSMTCLPSFEGVDNVIIASVS